MGQITDITHVNSGQSMSDLAGKARANAAERRRYPREEVFTAGVIFPEDADDDEHRRPIFVFNVSRGGLGFRSQSHFNEGSTFGVRIGTGPLHLTGRIQVLHCRVRPDGACDVNAQFL